MKIHFYKPRNIYGKLVSWATGNPICHVAIEHTIYGEVVLTQATGKHGVQVGKPNVRHTPAASLDIPAADEWVVHALVGYWAASYGWRDVLSFKFKSVIGQSGKNYKGIMCSELVTRVLVKAMNDKLLTPELTAKVKALVDSHEGNASDVSPGELFDHLMG